VKQASIKQQLVSKRKALLKSSVYAAPSIAARKRVVLKHAASAAEKPVDDVRRAFGFFPAGVEAKILNWPEL
jgi:hypothetical protein